MRSIFWRLIGLVLLGLVAGSVTAQAQQPGYPPRGPSYGYAPPPPPQQPYRDPRAYPPGYYPGKLVQPAQPQPDQGFTLRRLFGVQEPPPAQQQWREPVARPRKSSPPPAAVARQEKPKPNPTVHVVVFGDALADAARQGLNEIYAEEDTTDVISKVRPDSSLARAEPAEWPDAVRAALEAQKTSVAVVMLGLNDRQSIRDGDKDAELLSDRWTQLYRERVDGMLKTFQERNVPVVWIGLPPLKSGKASEDIVAINEIVRESVLRFRGAYVDIWPGFVDDENRYTATGPDVDGTPAKLRANDGVSFTKAGARKVAHFASTEIKRVLDAAPATPVAGSNPADPFIEAALPPPPDPAVPAPLPVKPLVGPVLPLTRPDVAPGGTLVSGKPKLTGDSAYPVQRALREGIAPSARPGRADDFRWPPG